MSVTAVFLALALNAPTGTCDSVLARNASAETRSGVQQCDAPLTSGPETQAPVSSLGWKSVIGISAVSVGGVAGLTGGAMLIGGAVVLTTPSDPEQGPVGFGLFAGGLVVGVVGAALATTGGLLLSWDLNDGE